MPPIIDLLVSSIGMLFTLGFWLYVWLCIWLPSMLLHVFWDAFPFSVMVAVLSLGAVSAILFSRWGSSFVGA